MRGRPPSYSNKTAVLLHLEKWERDYARSKGWHDNELWRLGFNARMEGSQPTPDILIKLAQKEREVIEKHQQDLIKLERHITEAEIQEQAKVIRKTNTRKETRIDPETGEKYEVVVLL